MENIILGIILVIILVPAIRYTYLRFSGKKSCCGGSGGNVPEKKLDGPVVEKYLANVEGMHCDNCKNSIMRNLNRLDGVSASVSLARNQVTISCSQEVDAEILKNTIEKLDFSVVDIQRV